MTWMKIIAFVLPAIIAIGGLYSTKPDKPKLVHTISVLIIIGVIVQIVLELKDSHSKKQQQKKAEGAIENLKNQNNELIAQTKDLKEGMVDFQTMRTLMPGNEPDPPTTVRDKPPADAIKLYLGSCIAWWKPNVIHNCVVLNIANEPVLSLSLKENGLFISGNIRQEDGRDVMNLTDNKYVRKPNVFIDTQRPNEHELTVSGKSGERLLYVNYLNEKAIAIKGIFYDAQGRRNLTITDREIVDIHDNHMQNACFGGSENIFSYQTLPQRHELTVRVTEPALIDSGYRIDYMYDGKIVENPSEATIIVSNTGTEPIRLGFDGEMEIAVPGQVLDLNISPPMAMSDYISWNGKRLKFESLIINPNEPKAINVLIQGEGKCDVHATLRDGKVIVK